MHFVTIFLAVRCYSGWEEGANKATVALVSKGPIVPFIDWVIIKLIGIVIEFYIPANYFNLGNRR